MLKQGMWGIAAAIIVAAPAGAQQSPRKTVKLKQAPGNGAVYQVSPPGTYTLTLSGRGRIGVIVDMRPSPNDSIGATVQSVTPGGPAAKAGIQGGDVITRLKGTALVDRAAHSDNSDDEDDTPSSQPGMKLLDLASHLAAGDTVAVEFRHGKDRKTAQLVAAESDGMMNYTMSRSGDTGMPFMFRSAPGGGFQYGFKLPETGAMPFMGNMTSDMQPMMRDRVFFRVGSPLGDMEFAPVNADLGRYFGVTDGILVLSVPDSAALDLKAGDVILTVGDRKPTSVSKLLGILQTYDDGESVTLDVMRDHKHVTVTGKADWSHPRWRSDQAPWTVQSDRMKLRTDEPRD